jgi:MoxR-like ATPase
MENVMPEISPIPGGVGPGFLARIGLHGLENLALPLLISLITLDALLLAGRHGSAKTTLFRRISAALGRRFRPYDASKTPFEDVLGFLDPTSLGQGQLTYVRTPLSAEGAQVIFIDEISRADLSMQSRFLEIVFGKSLMGNPLTELEWVAAAMNPSSYEGAGPVDRALLGRFAIVLRAPEYHQLSPADQRAAALASAGLSDGPGFDRDAEREGRWPQLIEFVEAARAAMLEARRIHGETVVDYVVTLSRVLCADDLVVDARRIGFLCRNLLAAKAAVAAGYAFPGDEQDLFGHVVEASFPFVAEDPDFDIARLRSAHAEAWGIAGDPDAAPLILVLGDGDPERALRTYLDLAATLEPCAHDRVVHRFQEELRLAPLQTRTGPALRLLRLLRAVQERHQDFPAELVARLLAWGRTFVGLGRDFGEELRSLLDRAPAGFDLQQPEGSMLARLALQLSLACMDDPSETPDIDLAARNLNLLRTGLSPLPSAGA